EVERVARGLAEGPEAWREARRGGRWDRAPGREAADPDLRLRAGSGWHRRSGRRGGRALPVRRADRARRRGRGDGTRDRALLPGAGALPRHAEAARDPGDRAGTSRPNHARPLLPGPLAHPAAQGSRGAGADHRERGKQAAARPDRLPQRSPVAPGLGPGRIRTQPGQRPLRPRPEPDGERAAGPGRLYPAGLRVRGGPLRGALRGYLPSGRRADGQGRVPQDGPEVLPARRPRPVERLRRVALSLPRRAGGGRGHTGRPRRDGALFARRPIRHPARRLGLGHRDHPLPRRVYRGDTGRHRGRRLRGRLTHHRVHDDARDPGDRGLHPDPAVRRQLPYPPHPGQRPPRPPHPRPARRHRRRRAGGPRRRRLRRPRCRRPPRLLRLSPRQAEDEPAI
ncbi:MAG: Uncharacterized UPF0118 membrane protein, partial [uncultured Rubrobacteraceae bacterium]